MKYLIPKITLFLSLSACVNLNAFEIPFSTSFESDTIGSAPAGFSALSDTGFAGNSLNVTSAESSFANGPESAINVGSSGQALQWLDTNTSDSNPDVVLLDRSAGNGFTQDVVIRFDFLNVSGNNLRFQTYDDTGTRGIRLDLDNGGTIKNNGGGGTLEFTGTNKWLSLEITTDLANDTYDLIIKRDDRTETKTYTGLAFNNSIANIGKMAFEDSSGASNTAEYHIDNISVSAVVPEPSAYALLFGTLSGCAVLLRRCTK